MNREEFIQKLNECDFDEFVDGSRADFVVQDDNGQAWMIERVPYDPENIVPEAIEHIEDCKLNPVRAKQFDGLVGYVPVK